VEELMRARPIRLIALALSLGVLCAASTAHAVSFAEFVDPHPAPGNLFGALVVPLSTGNVVITSPYDDAGGSDAGAVYLFNGSSGALISTLTGSSPGDQVGLSGVTKLPSGNYVIRSASWHNGAVANAGAVTWGSGISGVSGAISAANSLVGSNTSDQAGSGGVAVLTNGNYVVMSPAWRNPPFGVASAGAVTWGSGTSGVSGVISASNSLVGSSANDQVGGYGVAALTNGNYVVRSPFWDNAPTPDVGAATWGSGTAGVNGLVSASNSLVGSTAGDQVGAGVTSLTNGNYVVLSASWDNTPLAPDVGVATRCNGTTGTTGAVSLGNSLVGSTAGDNVGSLGATALANGSYVVVSPAWRNGANSNAGAATWGNSTTGVSGAVSAANSLVDANSNNRVGLSGVTALSNGNYLVLSPEWDNGASVNAGAATWGSGTSGVSGAVSAANSLVGSMISDQVGNGGVVTLSNGNYLVRSLSWHNGAVVSAGAVTWSTGTAGVSGAVSASNSLVGVTANDAVGTYVTALTNGNYVVASPSWDDGATADVGAATWGSGTSGVSGVISAANSLVGSTIGDVVGNGGATALTNGNYVVMSAGWNNGVIAAAGAVTWGSGTTGVKGVLSSATSLIGTTANDFVGGGGVVPLTNGNFVALSPGWHNGTNAAAGAATLANGTTGASGALSTANSLVGSTTNDAVGNYGATALPDGNYVVLSPAWNNSGNSPAGGIASAGAATWASGTAGLSGPVSVANSIVGFSTNSGLQSIVVDSVNGTFMANFTGEGGGRVRLGVDVLKIESVADIPSDQGGWLRLTFNRVSSDVGGGTPQITIYGLWRHVPGTFAAGRYGAGSGAQSASTLPAELGASPGARPYASLADQLRAAALKGVEVREADGRVYVTASDSPASGSRATGPAAAFPPGTWELLTSVPAVQQLQYVVVAPTTSNSIVNDFLVTGHTSTPTIWFVSAAASGQSVDNLAPPPPSPFTAAFVAGDTHLHWGVSAASDFGTFKLYRGSSADFVPAAGNMIAATTDTGYADVGASGNYYKLSAVDVNGNESAFAALGPVGTLDVAGDVKLEFALAGVRPNPSRGNRVMVDFTLPTAQPARLELVDVAGRRVVDRAVGGLGAGRHAVDLAAGRPLAPGIYLVKLTQGAHSRVVRAAVLR
jgi:hypothetical protein